MAKSKNSSVTQRVRLSVSVNAALVKRAENEKRTISNMIRLAILKYLGK